MKLGETLDDGTTLNKYSQALASVGVNIKDQYGNLKNMDQLLLEIADKWQLISKDQKIALAQTVAGVRQYNQFMAIFDNWDFMKQNLEVVQTGEGTLTEQQDIYADSWEAARNRVRAASEDIYDSIINPELFIWLDDAFTPILSRIADVIDALGGLKGVLTAVIFTMSTFKSEQMAQSLRNIAYNASAINGRQKEAIGGVTSGMINEVNSMVNRPDLSPQNRALAQQIKYTNDLQQASKYLADSERERLQTLIDILPVAAKLTEEAQRQTQIQKERDKALLNERMEDIITRPSNISDMQSRIRGRQLMSELNSQMLSTGMTKEAQNLFYSKFGNLKSNNLNVGQNYISDVEINKAKQAFIDYNKVLAKAQEAQKYLLNNTIDNKGTKQYNDSVKAILQTLNKIGKHNGQKIIDFSDEEKDAEKLNATLEKMIQYLQKAAEMSKINLMYGLGADEDELNQVIESIQEQRAKLWEQNGPEDIGNGFNQLNDEITAGLNNALGEANQRRVDWAATIVSTTQTLSSLALAMQSLSNLGTLAASDGFSVETFTQLTMSFAMLVPLITKVVEVLKTLPGALGLSAAAAETATTSTGFLATAIKGLRAAMTTALPYITAMVVIIGTLVAVRKAVDNYRDEKRRQAYELSNKQYEETKKELEAQKEAINTYKEAYKTYKETKENKGALIEAAQNMAKVLNTEDSVLVTLTGDYNKLNKELRETEILLNRQTLNNARTQKENLQHNQFRAEIQDATKQKNLLKEGGILEKQNQFSIDTAGLTGGLTVWQGEIYKRALKESGLDKYFQGTLNPITDVGTFTIHDVYGISKNASDEEYLEYYKAIKKQYELIKKYSKDLSEEQQKQMLAPYKDFLYSGELNEIFTKIEEQSKIISDTVFQDSLYSVELDEGSSVASLEEYIKKRKELFDLIKDNKEIADGDVKEQEKLIAAYGATTAKLKQYELQYQTISAIEKKLGTTDEKTKKAISSYVKGLTNDELSVILKILPDSHSTDEFIRNFKQSIAEATYESSKASMDTLSNLLPNIFGNKKITDEQFSAIKADAGLLEQIKKDFGEFDNFRYSSLETQKQFLEQYYVQAQMNNTLSLKQQRENIKQELKEEKQKLAFMLQYNQEYIDKLKEYKANGGTEFNEELDIINQIDEVKNLWQKYAEGTDKSEKELEDLQKGLESANEELSRLTGKDIHFELDDGSVSGIEDKIQEAIKKASENSKLQIEAHVNWDGTDTIKDSLSSLSSFMQALKKHGKDLGDSISFPIMEIYDYIEAYDGLFAQAKRVGEGQIEINKAIVEQYLDGLQKEREEYIKNKVAELNTQIEMTETQIEILDSQNKYYEDIKQGEIALDQMSQKAKIGYYKTAYEYILGKIGDEQTAASVATKIIGEDYSDMMYNIEEDADDTSSEVSSAANQAGEASVNAADQAREAAAAAAINTKIWGDALNAIAKGTTLSDSAIQQLITTTHQFTPIAVKESHGYTIENAKLTQKGSAEEDDGGDGNGDNKNNVNINNALDGILTKEQLKQQLEEQIKSGVNNPNQLESLLSQYENFNQTYNDYLETSLELEKVEKEIKEYSIANTEANIDANNKLKKTLEDNLNTLKAQKLSLLAMLGMDLSDSGKKASKAAQKAKKDTDKLNKKLDETIDRYHIIDRQIEYQTWLLGKLDKQISATYGADKSKLYQKRITYLEKMAELEKERLQYAKYHMDEDEKELSKLGLDPKIDQESKALLNYYDLMKKINDEFKAKTDEYNNHKLTEEYQKYVEQLQNLTGEEANIIKEKIDELDDAAEAMYDAAKTLYEDRKKAIKNYEDSVKQYQDTYDKYREQMYAKEETRLNDIKNNLQIHIDLAQAQKEVRELSKQINSAVGDALKFTKPNLELDKETYDTIRDVLEPLYQGQLTTLQELVAESETNEFINQDNVKQMLDDLRSNAISSAEDLLAFVETIETALPDALSVASERFDKFTNQLEHNTTILDTIKEIMTLQGLTLKTEQGYSDLKKLYKSRMDATLAEARLNREWYDDISERLQQAQNALVGVDENTEQYDILKGNRDALLEEYNKAQEAMLSSAKDTLQTARDMYVDEVERTAYELEQTLTKDRGFDLLQQKYDHYIDTEERYFDNVNQEYQILSYNNKVQKEIDKLSDKTNIKKLEALKEEIELRAENNKLSEYDVEIMEAKLEMLIKQMALEDAQNNKTKLRLVRNSQGNWDYQYTADQGAIDDANNEYLKAANDYYNIAKKQVKDTSKDIIDTWKEMTDKIKEIYEDESLTVAEREAQIAEIREYYTQKVKDLEEEKQIAMKDMTDAGQANIEAFREVTGENLDQMAEDIEDFIQSFQDDLDDMSEEVVNFEDVFDKTIQDMEDHVQEFGNITADVNDKVGISYEQLSEMIDETTESTYRIMDAGFDAIDMMSRQIMEIQNLTEQYAQWADEIIRTAEALRDLARASTEVEMKRQIEENNPYEEVQGKAETKKWLNDYDQVISAFLLNGGSTSSTTYWKLLKDREDKIKELRASGDTNDYGAETTAEMDKYFTDKASQGRIQQVGATMTKDDLLEVLEDLGYSTASMASHATGGYTGNFDGGKIGILHEKELILNQDDTKNILATVNTVRELGQGFWSGISNQLQSNIAISRMALAQQMSAFSISPIGQGEEGLSQNITIYADFPSATSANEIETALQNLVNDAIQYTGRR